MWLLVIMILSVEKEALKATVSSLIVEDLQGDYASYEKTDRWAHKLSERKLSPQIVGQQLFTNHRSGNFRAETTEDFVIAGSLVHLKISGITPLAALVILGGRLDDGPPEALGKIVIPFKDSLDVLTRIPEDAEGGTYVLFAQQWEVSVDWQGRIHGLPAYPGGSLIYVSKMSSVEVRSEADEEGSPWTAVLAKEMASMRRFPGLAFRGPVQDRRAWVVGTAFDVWEIIEAYKTMGLQKLLQEGDLTEREVRLALRYYEADSEEIDQLISENQRTEEEWHRLYPEVFAPPEQTW